MVIVILLALLVMLESFIGVEMVNTPPTTNRYKWFYRISFFVLGVGIILLTCLQYHDSQKVESKNIATINRLTNQIAEINTQQSIMAQLQQRLVNELSTNTSIDPGMRQRIVESDRQFEELNSVIGGLNGWRSEFRNKRMSLQLQHEINREKEFEADQSYYEKGLRMNEYAVETLEKMMEEVATSNGDKAVSNFHSIPATIDFMSRETNIAEIKLKMNPNWDFKVSFFGDPHKQLKVACQSGYIYFSANFSSSAFNSEIYIPGQDTLSSSRPIQDYKLIVDEALKYLIALHAEQLDTTNKIFNP